MRVTVYTEARLVRTPDGAAWTQSAVPYSFWTRYLEVFDSVRVVARVRPVETVAPNSLRVDGPSVDVIPLPFYVGPAGFVAKVPATLRVLSGVVRNVDAVVLRVPSFIGSRVAARLQRVGKPYAVEVVGDPYEVFAPGAVRHALRPYLRRQFTSDLKRVCAGAHAVAYVTSAMLQRRYPAAPGAITESYSSIELTDSAFAETPRKHPASPGRWRLVTVASLAQLYKGQDVLLRAVATCVAGGLDLGLIFVGDGKYRRYLEALSDDLGLGPRVTFTGELPGSAAVRSVVQGADMFVLPSRTEGLPRAMIEAMALGLPCIGSDAGGIPELLPPDARATIGDHRDLAQRIESVLLNPATFERMSARNIDVARQYHIGILSARRTTFYAAIRDLTRQWLTEAQSST